MRRLVSCSIRVSLLAGVAAVLWLGNTDVRAYTAAGAGYTVIDSEQAGGPPFSWVDPTTHPALTLATTTTWTAGDEGAATVTIPWTFTFFSTGYTSVAVSSNGLIVLGGGSTGLYGPGALPGAGAPNNQVAVFGGDLDGDNSPPSGTVRSAVVGAAPNRRLVISWVNWDFYGGTDTLTCQVILYEAGGANAVLCQYQTMTGPQAGGSGAVVGIENAGGTLGLVYQSFGTPATNNTYAGLAVGFHPTGATPPWLAPPPPPPPPPPPGGGGGGPVIGDDESRVHRMCGGGASAAFGLGGLALVLATLIAFGRR